MTAQKQVTLEKTCPAVRIPAGDTVYLPAGGEFSVVQALGGSITLRDSTGLYRVGEEDFDALGEGVVARLSEAEQAPDAREPFSEEMVWKQLRQCFDPEIPLNIVDLGLIYDLQLDEVEPGQWDVAVKMTLTAPGCGMGPTIANDARAKIEAIGAVRTAEVEVVWDPQWNPHMISEEGRQVLGID